MKYVSWLLVILSLFSIFYLYRFRYLPLRASIDRLKQEISMWEELMKAAKGISEERNRFPVDKFFQDDKLTPYGEIEILRKLDRRNKRLEIFITAPNALTRLKNILKFFDEQNIEYQHLYCIAVIDSVEQFEYKYPK